ncbi:MAG: OB-fold nucleic acid binding domain-containing protein [Methanobrevibacter sp.]|uniref:OB-fold nucleic acid binding domain-containing protein n=1 Tax=Methanobrevibacter sp. TaxID=66852 RepID=UPI0026E0EFDF|nr:OB-fold nucleic acid binding domain-containing protein [Methanobrevibacter sp.]MDO5848471.1 OB-fold nucleic acid binding domain-containing protein [Methanobrevibacter sp.]
MEITDDKLIKIALITTLVGIIGLIVFTPSIEVKEVNVEDLTKGMIDEQVAIAGVVEEIKPSSSGSTYFLKVNDGTGLITAIAFDSVVSDMEDSNLSIEMFKDKKVRIDGKVTEYNSKMELIISDSSSIKILN